MISRNIKFSERISFKNNVNVNSINTNTLLVNLLFIYENERECVCVCKSVYNSTFQIHSKVSSGTLQ